ncbi:MAG: methyl-accepting chemotaxis protein [Chitinivibrionales bacterium]|nr:methyl-accepting chemotaxis protein [Chitinivibrionales bacterium]
MKLAKIEIYYREHLWAQLMLKLVVPIFCSLTVIMIWSIVNVNLIIKNQMFRQGNTLIESVFAGIQTLLPMGDDQLVNDQLKHLREANREIDVWVFDFNKEIHFSTDSFSQGKFIDAILTGKEIDVATGKMLRDGMPPDKPFESLDKGIHHIAVARPVLNSQECFHCHGQTRKILGGIITRAPSQQAVSEAGNSRNVNVLIAIIGLLVTILSIFILIRTSVNKPVQALLDLAAKLRRGDLTFQVPVTARTEISHICARMNLVSNDLRTMIGETVAKADTIAAAALQLTSSAEKMLSQSQKSSDKSDSVAVASEQMSSNLTSVANTTKMASSNVLELATAMKEMNSSINEIAGNSERARSTSNRVVSLTQGASAAVKKLGDSAHAVKKVTETINRISDQTKLLALNATIEAAGAGEAGKGFAVVANEVRVLAGEADKASKDIKERIEGIQKSSNDVVSEIEKILGGISEVGTSVAAIASAVEEQATVTNQMTQRVSEVSNGVGEIAVNVDQNSIVAQSITKDIAYLRTFANESSSASKKVDECANELATLAKRLQQEMIKFKI